MTTTLDRIQCDRGFDVEAMNATQQRTAKHLQDRATEAEHVAFIEEVKADLQKWHPEATAREIQTKLEQLGRERYPVSYAFGATLRPGKR